MVYSTCNEPKGSSSGRRLYAQICYSKFHMHRYRESPPRTRRLTPMPVKHAIAYVCYNRLPEYELTGSKHVEDYIEIKVFFQKRCILLAYIT